jgi:membrane protein implicated in regulation of membrane protease activity
MIEWMIPWWGWFIFGFLLLLLELASPSGFYFLFFGIGALSVGILAWLNLMGEAWVELTFFSMFSIIACLLFRKRLQERFGPKTADRIVDSMVGEAAMAIDNIEAGSFGKVELRGTTWNARNNGDRMLKRGERCKVEQVDGLSLWVTKEG